jgi:bifunctional ADP-heptose synthase (sugar kinase/adenylyltransferase)
MIQFEVDQVNTVSATTHELADVIGAGGNVIGILASMVACSLSFQQVMTLANKADGLVVAKFGNALFSYNELIA